MLKARRVSLAFILLVLAATSSTCFSQTPTTTSQAAYVYVSNAKGVYLYNAASNGALTPVAGSPFSVAGSPVGSNGKYLVSLGTDYIHTYSIASNGAIQAQVSQIDTKTYFSNPATGCGATAGGVLNHTGQDVYVLRGLNGCAALQSYQISSAGILSFLDSSSFESGITDPYTPPPAITADDLYGYTGRYVGFCSEDTDVFQRQSNGAMISITAGGASDFRAS